MALPGGSEQRGGNTYDADGVQLIRIAGGPGGSPLISEFTARGVFDDTTTDYIAGDVVQYGGDLYIASDSAGDTVPLDPPPDVPAVWMQVYDSSLLPVGGSDTDTLTGEVTTTDDTPTVLLDEAPVDGEVWIVESLSIVQVDDSGNENMQWSCLTPEANGPLVLTNFGGAHRASGTTTDNLTSAAAGNAVTAPELATTGGGLLITVIGNAAETWKHVAKARITRVTAP